MTNLPLVKSIISPACILLFSAFSIAGNISLEQVKADVSFLASNELKGRANFTPGIDKAANYIAKRFSEIGLKPLSHSKQFKQNFHLYQFSTASKTVQLNHKKVSAKRIIALTNHQSVKWSNKNDISIVYIAAEDDFKKKLRQVNQQNKNFLVIVNEKHQAVFNRFHQHFSQIKKLTKNQGPSAVLILSSQPKIKSFSINIQSKMKTLSLANVVGQLPGKKKAEEILLISAHYDHLGSNSKLKKDSIYNGADDDASGTTAVINLAQYYAKHNNNQRTLIFVAFTAEEIGGFGSQYFSTQLKAEKIIAMLNIEMIGKPSKFGHGALWMTGYKRSNLAKILNNNLSQSQIHPDPYPQERLFYRSDNATLARLGVPAHSFSSSQIDIDQHYHRVSDQIETLNMQSMTQIINTLAKATNSLADGSDTPSRVNTSKVKATGYFF